MSYTNIPNELWDFMIDQKSFSRQTRIFAIIVRFTICYHREFHELSLSFIAERLDVRRDHVSEEIKKMIDSNMIRSRQEGNKRLLAIGLNVPEFGNIGVPKNRDSDVPKNGYSGVPKNGYQENNNIKINNLNNDLFETFWDAYPRKASKSEARKAFDEILNEHSFELIMHGVERYNQTIQQENREERFIKYPSRWLRDEAFMDIQFKPVSNSLRLLELHTSQPNEEEDDYLRQRYARIRDLAGCK